MEVVQKLTQEEEKNEKLYLLILETLDDLKRTKLLKKLRYKFVYQILVLLGFWPKSKKMRDPDEILTEVVERELFSVRVGKKLVS
jgi:recombinational DNA repair protein (RecF pathway)